MRQQLCKPQDDSLSAAKYPRKLIEYKQNVRQFAVLVLPAIRLFEC